MLHMYVRMQVCSIRPQLTGTLLASVVINSLSLQLKAFYVDLLVPLETNLEKDTKVVQVSNAQRKTEEKTKARFLTVKTTDAFG